MRILFMIPILLSLANAEEIVSKPIAIDELLHTLDSEDYDTREAAFNGLLKAGEAALAPLKKALAETKGASLEFKGRIQRIIDLYEGGTVNGLKIKLEADKAKVGPGDEINFTTTLYNLTDKDMNVLVSRETSENFFRFGAALRMIRKTADATDGGQPLLPVQIEPGHHSYYHAFVKLAPKGTLQFTCKGALEAPKSGDTGKGLRLIAGGYTVPMLHAFSGLQSGTYYVSVEHAVNSEDIIPPGNGNKAVDYTLPFWTGTIGSNRIQIQVDGASEK